MSTPDYAGRRQRLLEHLDGGAALLVAPSIRLRNADTEYPFRQSSDMLYLFGLHEPEMVALFRDGNEASLTMFVRPRDPIAERWNGPRLGVEGIREQTGAEAYPLSELTERLPALLVGTPHLAVALGEDESWDREVLRAVRTARSFARRGKTAPTELRALDIVLGELRLRKTSDELAVMRRAAAITAAGFEAGMRATCSGLGEYELEAIIESTYARHGAQDVAYPSIVAGGANATTLHYATNREHLRSGDLVLVDSGCELDGYASDVTRTWPVDGRFSGAQRALYEIVLAAQKAAYAELSVGKPVNAYHETAVRVITEGLRDVGLLSGSLDELLTQQAYRPFYMHQTGHWLGLDVHDVGSTTRNGRSRLLETGMVLTVEPGLYIPAELEVAEHFRGIGIRIEDDVHITETTPEILTEAIPREITDVEQIIGRAR